MSFGSVVFLLVLVGLVIAIVVTYNKLVGLRQRSEEAWSDIDVQLKRRTDLVPNLVETVKGYAAHERGTLDQVIRARGAAARVPSGAKTVAVAKLAAAAAARTHVLTAMSDPPRLAASRSWWTAKSPARSASAA